MGPDPYDLHQVRWQVAEGCPVLRFKLEVLAECGLRVVEGWGWLHLIVGLCEQKGPISLCKASEWDSWHLIIDSGAHPNIVECIEGEVMGAFYEPAPEQAIAPASPVPSQRGSAPASFSGEALNATPAAQDDVAGGMAAISESSGPRHSARLRGRARSLT